MVKQVFLDVPEEIEKKIMIGLLERSGSVVRDSKTKRIVKHLDEVAGNSNNVLKQVLVGIGVVSVATAIVAGAVVIIGDKKREEFNEIFKGFNKSVDRYFSAMSDGKMSIKVINNLEDHVLKVSDNLKRGTIKIIEKECEINKFETCVIDYTMKFAEANNFECKTAFQSGKNFKENMDNIKSCIEIQKEILSQAA